MNPSICNICGANYENRNGRWKCPACGAYKPEELSNEELTLMFVADQKRRIGDFEEAERAYTDIIEKYPQNCYGYWGRLLSKHGIKYERDYDGRMIATCCAPTIESLYSDKDCLNAIDLADSDTKQYFKSQAEYIESIRDLWIKKASKEKPYDIFICYKDSDLANNINRTIDSFDAQNLYTHLVEKGYRVFFSRESLRDKIGEKYEPYIFGALSSAKVMIVYGNSSEYITSTWLKNEWTRYQKMMREGTKKPNSLIVAYKGFSPSELPTSLSSAQCLDASGWNFYTDLDKAIKGLLEKKKEEAKVDASTKKSKAKAITCPTCGGNFSTDDLLDGDKIVTCLVCGNTFLTSEILKENGKKLPKEKAPKKELSHEEIRMAEERATKFKKGKFSKVILCCMVLFAALAVACFTNDGFLAGIIALTSSGLFLIAYLLGIQVLKKGNLNLHIVAAVLAFLLLIPYCIVGADINFGDDTDYSNTFEWQTNGLFSLLPVPNTTNGKITSETEKQIQFELYNVSLDDFNKYAKACRENGFNVDVTKNDDVFYAKTTDGYDLAFFYYDDTKVLKVSLDSYDVETPPEQSGGNNTNQEENNNTNQSGEPSQSGGSNNSSDLQGEKIPDSTKDYTVNSNIQLAVNEYRFQGRTGTYYSFFEITNNSTSNLRLTMNVKFYNGTTIVGTEEETAYSFESGRTILLYASNDTEYTKADLEFSAKKEDSYKSILSELSYEISHGGTKEIVTISNNTNKTAVAMECVILFFNNGKVVAFDTEYFMNDDGYLLPGSSITKEMYTTSSYTSYEAYYMGRGEY